MTRGVDFIFTVAEYKICSEWMKPMLRRTPFQIFILVVYIVTTKLFNDRA